MITVRIDRRFRGPPDSANGGYVAGVLAKRLGGSDVVVTLRQPAPLDTDLTLDGSGDAATLSQDDRIIAVAERQTVAPDVPAPPSIAQAGEAEQRFDGGAHLYPGCFVCGPDRAADDGWRIFAGPVATGRVAATWTPPREFADERGTLGREFIWAALDCPGYFAVEARAGLALLGRIGVRIYRDVSVGTPLIVTGWDGGSEGRKHRAGTALHDRDGLLLAASNQTWVSLR